MAVDDVTPHDDHGHGHDDHGHGHGHDDHGPAERDSWVLLPLAVGLVIGIVIALLLGTGSGVSPL